MALETIKKVNITEQVLEQLKKQIIEETWKVGERIPSELELTEMLGVSRSTVRQALRSLNDCGMIEIRLGSGSYVKRKNILPITLQQEDIMEVLDFSCIFENDMAKMATLRATDEDIDNLKEIQRKIESVTCDCQMIADLDLEFHLKIAKITRNSLVIQTYGILNELLNATMYEMYLNLGIDTGKSYHRRLIGAMEARDFQKAKTIMEEHVNNRRDKYLEILEKRSKE